MGVGFQFAQVLLSGAIQYLLQAQKTNAMIMKAHAEGREITAEELETLRTERDTIILATEASLDKLINGG